MALKLADMKEQEDVLPGDVIIATHVCSNAPTTPHEPVPFMGSPVDMKGLNDHEVAKHFGGGQCRFYDEEEFKRIVELYGSMNHLQTLGGKR
jgi:hypothetical protein